MKSRTARNIIMVSGVIVIIVIALLSQRRSDKDQSRIKQLEEKLAKMTTYCYSVHQSLARDTEDLASGNPVRQAKGADKFLSLTTFHSEDEIELCSTTMPDLESWRKCWMDKDYQCLAVLAEKATESTDP